MQETIVFDFDGVVHSYDSGWCGAENIPDPPVAGVPGVIVSLREMGYKVVIVSTRCACVGGIEAVREWLDRYDIVVDDVTAEKPPAKCYVDDRAICFDGNTDTLLTKIHEFQPWYRR